MRLHKLDLNLLIVLDLLLKNRNVSHVAAILGLTQSAISNSLGRLRAHFEDDLLIQSGREMVATPLALDLADAVGDLTHRARAIALTRASFVAVASERDFSIVVSDYLASLLLGDLVRRITAEAPRVTITQAPMPDARGDGAGQPFDVIIGSNVALDSTVRTCPLWEEQPVPVVWAGNPYAAECVSMAEIERFTHVSVALDQRLNADVVDSVFASREVGRTKMIRLRNLILVPEFLIGTPYMAILPLRFALQRSRDLPLRILKFDFDFPKFVEKLQWPAYLDKDPSNIWLREMIRASADHVGRELAGELGP